ncbi:hypothetical protein [Jeotgalibacillus soli]|uniref:DUF3953 domain-containing protein n=1 Tax=Jeotgalibacillus soli TaxID=889306 RepID=A0A0C2VH62_9BACL|nr:hypothetical protein [Jeotgalibacillus soli]KIL48217.1 hypothetical protein KP78_16640 [Jeotgalibacillus soli]
MFTIVKKEQGAQKQQLLILKISFVIFSVLTMGSLIFIEGEIVLNIFAIGIGIFAIINGVIRRKTNRNRAVYSIIVGFLLVLLTAARFVV